MREIKFRAWDGFLEKMLDTKEFEQSGMNLFAVFEIKGKIIPMQYTGTVDKNGKEIYEGDIIRLVNESLTEIKVVCEFGKVVRVIEGNGLEIVGFYYKRLDDGRKTFPLICNYLGAHDHEIFEVIGNIYENPELVAGGTKQ